MKKLITIKIDCKNGIKRLKELQRKFSDMTPAMRDIADIMFGSTMDNFDAGGRPKWKALSSLTLKIKAKKGFNTSTILKQEGDLERSMTRAYGKNYAVVGTNIIYGPIHQFGGVIKPRTGKYLAIPAGKNKKGKEEFIRIKQAIIPARPYLALTEDDKQEIVGVIEDYLKGI